MLNPDEPKYLIPRQWVLIPRHTSIIKTEPSYVFPILKAKYTPLLPDPANAVQVIARPETASQDRWHHTVPQQSAIEVEAARLRVEYGDNPRTNVSWFDTCYPTLDVFAQAFKAALRTAKKVGSYIDPRAVAALTPLKGIDRVLAARLIEKGFDSVEKLALADEADLANKIEGLGPTRIAQVIASAREEQESRIFGGREITPEDLEPVVLDETKTDDEPGEGETAEIMPPATDPLDVEAQSFPDPSVKH